MKRILRHVGGKDFRKTHQRKLDEQKALSKIERKRKLQEKKEIEEVKKIANIFKCDWRSELFVEEKYIEEDEDLEINVKVPEKLKSNWRKELNEAMSSKDFEYLYGMSISNIQISSVLSNVQNTMSQDIVQASSDFVTYQFGNDFPGSFINSIGDAQINSQSKVDVVAFLDTSYGNVSGIDQSYRLTTGPEGFPPEGQSPPGSVISRVNLESALGITLPSGVPNGNLGGTPIEGSAIKRIFTDARPGRRINFNWTFASSEDALGAATVDDYAFVAIKGRVTKFVSVLTRGLQYGGQFVYTVQPEDIVDGKVEVGIGVVDVYDPYIQTALNISNFGSFWGAGTLGDTTDAADLGMSVASATPQSQQKKEAKKGKTQQQTKELQKQSQSSPISTKQQSIIDKSLSYSSPVIDVEMEKFARGLSSFDQTRKNNLAKGHYDSAITQINNLTNGKYPVSDETLTNLTLSIRRYELLSGQKFDGSKIDGSKNINLTSQQIAAELSKAVDAARAEYLKPGQTYQQIMASYAKLQAAIKASTDHALSSLRNPTPTTPPTPEKLANIEASLKQLEIDKQKDRDEANRRNWELAANIGMDALTAAALLSPIPGDEAVAIGARTASQTRAFARNFQRQNPGKYNPFLPDKANALARKQGVGTNVGGQNPAFRQPIKNSYEPQANVIMERKTLKTVQQALYPGQPSPNGFPDAPPPKMVNGYHPDFGQKDNMYNTLDKISANSMPLTGNPQIDKKVLRARKQPK